jgi:iron complex transport system permease protein
MNAKTKHNGYLIFFGIFLILVVFGTPFIGSQSLDYRNVVSFLRGNETVDGIIFFRIRLPRIFLGICTGAALSLAGVVFQALLRNPLATPYTLGVSAGGALGAVLMIKLGIDISFLGFTTIQTAAFLSSILTIFFVYFISKQSGRISIHSMILAGVTISYFFGAAVLMVHFMADFTETREMIHWMMGSLDSVDIEVFYKTIPVLLVAFALLFFQARDLNIISTSEEVALSKGVAVGFVQKIIFISASLVTGLMVAISGPIGFVGLIVPHLLRLLLGVDHRYLIPASILFGGAFLTLCDTVSRTLLSPIDIPVGIVTALLGGPFFLWLLMKEGKNQYT